MIRSMTGFASVSREEPGARVTVTIKSVNHRYLDVVVKAPQSLGAIESRVRSLIQQRVARGRIGGVGLARWMESVEILGFLPMWNAPFVATPDARRVEAYLERVE